MIKQTVSFEVEIAQDWIDMFGKYADLFGYNYCGYWLRHTMGNEDTGFLVWEDDCEHAHGKEPDRKAAIKAWKAGKSLPKHWFRMDRDTAIKAWTFGVARWGVGWYEDADAVRYDYVVQMALLGEVRYG